MVPADRRPPFSQIQHLPLSPWGAPRSLVFSRGLGFPGQGPIFLSVPQGLLFRPAGGSSPLPSPLLALFLRLPRASFPFFRFWPTRDGGFPNAIHHLFRGRMGSPLFPFPALFFSFFLRLLFFFFLAQRWRRLPVFLSFERASPDHDESHFSIPVAPSYVLARGPPFSFLPP